MKIVRVKLLSYFSFFLFFVQNPFSVQLKVSHLAEKKKKAFKKLPLSNLQKSCNTVQKNFFFSGNFESKLLT